MKVSELMGPKVVAVGPKTPLREVLKLMLRYHLNSLFGNARLAVNDAPLPRPVAQVSLDQCCINLDQLQCSEHGSQSSQRGLVGHVRRCSPNRRLGVVLQEKIHPFTERSLLALANNIKGVVVSGGKAFAELTLRLIPVGCVG